MYELLTANISGHIASASRCRAGTLKFWEFQRFPPSPPSQRGARQREWGGSKHRWRRSRVTTKFQGRALKGDVARYPVSRVLGTGSDPRDERLAPMLWRRTWPAAT